MSHYKVSVNSMKTDIKPSPQTHQKSMPIGKQMKSRFFYVLMDGICIVIRWTWSTRPVGMSLLIKWFPDEEIKQTLSKASLDSWGGWYSVGLRLWRPNGFFLMEKTINRSHLYEKRLTLFSFRSYRSSLRNEPSVVIFFNFNFCFFFAGRATLKHRDNLESQK